MNVRSCLLLWSRLRLTTGCKTSGLLSLGSAAHRAEFSILFRQIVGETFRGNIKFLEQSGAVNNRTMYSILISFRRWGMSWSLLCNLELSARIVSE